MDIRVGDVIRLKKEHPCGSREWKVLRVGADFRICCQGCGRTVMVPREKLEKKVRRIMRNGEIINPNAVTNAVPAPEGLPRKEDLIRKPDGQESAEQG